MIYLYIYIYIFMYIICAYYIYIYINNENSRTCITNKHYIMYYDVDYEGVPVSDQQRRMGGLVARRHTTHIHTYIIHT
jgi:hypothetical protein